MSPKGLLKLQEENDGEEITLRKPRKDGRESFLDRPLVVDLGTYTTKIGFASADIQSGSECLPSLMVPTLIGVTKLLPGKLSESCNQWGAPGSSFVGFEALRRSSLISLKYPMEHGIIMDWDEIG